MVLEIKDLVLGHFLIKVEELPGSNDLRSFSTTFEIVNPLHYQDRESGVNRVGVNRNRDYFLLGSAQKERSKNQKSELFLRPSGLVVDAQ